MWNLKRYTRARGVGSSTVLLGVGAGLITMAASTIAVDTSFYFAAQNQLQTAVDAAALAGAAALPDGTSFAKTQATAMAQENLVAGQELASSDLTYRTSSTTFEVAGKKQVPTIMAKFVCALSAGGTQIGEEGDGDGDGDVDTSHCDFMTVKAYSKALPAARDTILVIDASNSMDDLGNNRPMADVKSAAVSYVNTILNFHSESVDRIGLVSFHQTATLRKALKSQTEDSNFTSLKSSVNSISLFSGTGWNTNYQVGLKAALDELQSHGRPNAQKIIIFMTDGMPNLPAPTSYYSYDSDEPYKKCTDIVDNSAAVKAKCKKTNGQTVCPVLPSSTITDSMISSSAVSCGTTYVNNMQTVTNAQTDRAKTMDVTIHTINISNVMNQQNSEAIVKRLLKNPNWEPNQVHYMASTTDGLEYEATQYRASEITNVYNQIAEDIHIKLSQ